MKRAVEINSRRREAGGGCQGRTGGQKGRGRCEPGSGSAGRDRCGAGGGGETCRGRQGGCGRRGGAETKRQQAEGCGGCKKGSGRPPKPPKTSARADARTGRQNTTVRPRQARSLDRPNGSAAQRGRGRLQRCRNRRQRARVVRLCRSGDTLSGYCQASLWHRHAGYRRIRGSSTAAPRFAIPTGFYACQRIYLPRAARRG